MFGCGVPPDDPHATTAEVDNADAAALVYMCEVGFQENAATYTRTCTGNDWIDPAAAGTFPCAGLYYPLNKLIQSNMVEKFIIVSFRPNIRTVAPVYLYMSICVTKTFSQQGKSVPIIMLM